MSEAVSAPRRDTAKHTEATPASSGGGLSHRQILTILSGLMLGMFLAALDQTIVSTSIRTIADDLHGLSQQAWATTAYLITSTIATPLYGKLSDLHGRKPYFLGAISIFILGSAACTFSTSMTELAAFRALQGIGAGGLMSLALAIIGDIVPPRERARYQGYMLATFATSSVAGPLIGGFLAGQDSILGVVGWRWVFLVNVPIGIIALFVVAKVLNIPHTRRARRIDWWGAFTIALGVVPLLLVAEQGREWGWDSSRSLSCYGIGVVGIISWILVERRMGDDALIPMRLFRNAIFSKTSLLSVLIGAGMFGGMLMIPQYLQIVKGASPTKSGLEMLPLMLGMIIASIVSGQITAKTGRYKIFPTIGTVLMVTALLLFHFKVQWDTPLWQSMIYMLVFGLGLGGCMQTLVLAVQNAVPPQDMGVATASSTFFRQMGATAGTAIFLSVLFSNVGDKISSAFKSAAGTHQFQSALHDPAVLSDPANKPVLDMLQHPGAGGGSSDVLSDSSFIQHLDPRLAEPFKQGFADSMHVVFLIAAGVIAVAFLMVLWTKEVPLRKMSGLEARAAEEGSTASDAAAETPVTAMADTAEAVEAAPVASLATALADEPASGVRGHIRDIAGSPVAGAVVTLIDLRGSQLGRTTTQADGRYAVAAPAEGTYVLIASGGARQPQATTITVADGLVDFDLVLSGAAGLTGTVLATPDDRPLPGALVTATDVRGEVVASAAADHTGEFGIADLAPGNYTLVVSAPGHRPSALPAEVAGSTANRYEIRLAPGAHVHGTVRNRAGHPVDDARVTLLDAAGNTVATTVTDAHGAYAFNDLDTGDYTVIATGYAPQAVPLRVSGEGEKDADVNLGH
ncbi:DHA2 family efflux MFS transporter permease subunit [Streptomyces sp. NBC_01003]|uniref:MFS transporter n=1 Tax=Streptomyces sp. NBC_01003 TaxID=2903714 RepID=UPI00386F350B|nr:DHA2 family efflux MFS transporter permease subunit [Streptomyces sp. NBC_01003]